MDKLNDGLFKLRLRDAEVTGYVVIVLTVQSLTRLLVAVEQWEREQE